ncbi:hypothetical protein CDCA_CDCA09G2566 [Cyanidium caldarium]|uniref:serine C-palmitoyltransferase n=1 Tax=Cyanidium caldarium TaxID=2771 RepID=A0AAV9IWK2_CYACA|nr:hypothetical protein CDCA_CDCA09G2566 [Cyanidium caldarium]
MLSPLSILHFLSSRLLTQPTLVYHLLIEGAFAVLVVYLFLQKAYAPEHQHRARRKLTLKRGAPAGVGDDLTEAEIDALCAEWVPEPLVPSPVENTTLSPHNDRASEATVQIVQTAVSVAVGAADSARMTSREMRDAFVVTSLDASGHCTVQTQDRAAVHCVNLASANYAGLLGHDRIREACKRTLKKYGCGACGPRGFYGTTDVHLWCEHAIAKFMHTPEAILYSFGPATSTSAINAFAKKGDIVFADECINFPLQNGLQLSRSTVVWFRHNDLDDLEHRVAAIEAIARKQRRPVARRFIVVEGVYALTGDVAPLDGIAALRRTHRNLRFFVDESHALGVLGSQGRGACEHFGLELGRDVDIIVCDMGHALATVGGFCVGDEPAVVDHQRLSGAGYCFSAAQPPYLAQAGITALEILAEEPQRTQRVRDNAALLRGCLRARLPPCVVVEGNSDASPLICLRVRAEAAQALTERVLHLVQATGRELGHRTARSHSREATPSDDNDENSEADSSEFGDDDALNLDAAITDAAMRRLHDATAKVAAATAQGLAVPGAFNTDALRQLVLERLWLIIRERLVRHGVWASVPQQLPSEHLLLPPALALHVSAAHTREMLEDAANIVADTAAAVLARPPLSLGDLCK